MASGAIHVQDLIDRQAVGRLHIVVVGLCAAVMCVDGFDMFMIGAIAPAIAAAFGKPVSAMVTVFLCQQIGIACGAIIVGPISDRYGRKTLLIVCSAAFGVLMLATTASRSLWELAVLRGASGFFLSGIYPVATTLVSEFAPKRWRAAFLSILLTGFVASATAGGAFAAILVAAQGWQNAFWLGGFVPLILLLPLAFFLPESVQFRARHDAHDTSIAATLNRLSPAANIPADATFLANVPGQGAAHWLDVIGGSRRLSTLLLWLIFFLAMGNGALVSSWLPSVFKATQGVPIERFAQFMLMGSVTAIVGTLCIGFLVDRYRGSLVMMTCYVLNAAMLLAIGIFPFRHCAFHRCPVACLSQRLCRNRRIDGYRLGLLSVGGARHGVWLVRCDRAARFHCRSLTGWHSACNEPVDSTDIHGDRRSTSGCRGVLVSFFACFAKDTVCGFAMIGKRRLNSHFGHLNGCKRATVPRLTVGQNCVDLKSINTDIEGIG